MNYPALEVPYLGGGLLIAIISIVHVYVAHFAVGGALFLVLTEAKAYREKDQGMLEYVKGHSRFFVLLSLVFGALTGVGIWFIVGLVAPSATSQLINLFLWFWAMEYVPFFLELFAALIYYYGWDRLSPKMHLTVGWIYTGAAFASLVFINGILTFMLTPGDWPVTGNVWDAWLNPTAIPSAIMRSAVALAIAGLYGLLTSTRIRGEELRTKMIRYSAQWLWPAMVGLPLGGIWYFSQVPEPAVSQATGGAAAVTIFLFTSLALSALIFTFAYLGPYRDPKRFSFTLAVLFVLLGLFVTGTSEWVREAIRKPWVIYGVMYSNSLRPGDLPEINRVGILNSAKWARPVPAIPGSDPKTHRIAVGREVFRLECEPCHAVVGYNGIKDLVRGWNEEFTFEQLEHLDILKGFMPPFAGTEAERRALASYLASLNPKARR